MIRFFNWMTLEDRRIKQRNHPVSDHQRDQHITTDAKPFLGEYSEIQEKDGDFGEIEADFVKRLNVPIILSISRQLLLVNPSFYFPGRIHYPQSRDKTIWRNLLHVHSVPVMDSFQNLSKLPQPFLGIILTSEKHRRHYKRGYLVSLAGLHSA